MRRALKVPTPPATPNNAPNYDVPITTTGAKTMTPWYRWFQGLGGGLTVTVTTAKLTGGGANGSLTFTNGVLTAYKAAT
jgi:hypothetical protein